MVNNMRIYVASLSCRFVWLPGAELKQWDGRECWVAWGPFICKRTNRNRSTVQRWGVWERVVMRKIS